MSAKIFLISLLAILLFIVFFLGIGSGGRNGIPSSSSSSASRFDPLEEHERAIEEKERARRVMIDLKKRSVSYHRHHDEEDDQERRRRSNNNNSETSTTNSNRNSSSVHDDTSTPQDLVTTSDPSSPSSPPAPSPSLQETRRNNSSSSSSNNTGKKRDQEEKQKEDDSAPATITAPVTITTQQRYYPKKEGQLKIPPGIQSVIIDVGTNANPEWSDMALRDPRIFYIGVEPIKWQEAKEAGCRGMEHRCTILPYAIFNKGKLARFNVGFQSACSSLLNGGQRCGKAVAVKTVQIATLDEIIDKIPDHLPVSLIALDCQGSDFQAVASLRKHRQRVANVILECQDWPVGSPSLIYQDARTKTCGQIRDCLSKHWHWVPGPCTINYRWIRENNCAFHNPTHPLFNSSLRHPTDTHKETALSFTAECPVGELLALDPARDPNARNYQMQKAFADEAKRRQEQQYLQNQKQQQRVKTQKQQLQQWAQQQASDNNRFIEAGKQQLARQKAAAKSKLNAQQLAKEREQRDKLYKNYFNPKK